MNGFRAKQESFITVGSGNKGHAWYERAVDRVDEGRDMTEEEMKLLSDERVIDKLYNKELGGNWGLTQNEILEVLDKGCIPEGIYIDALIEYANGPDLVDDF